MVLCGANAYNKKYYFNPDMDLLPAQVQDELQILCVSFTEQVGGVLTLEFDEQGKLQLRTEAADEDYFYDEIDSTIRVQRLCEEKQELFSQLELFYRTFLAEDE